MFYLIMRITDKKPCSYCRHNSNILCFQQGNVIIYLFDEIWVFKKVHYTPYCQTKRRMCLNISSFGTLYFPKMYKFTILKVSCPPSAVSADKCSTPSMQSWQEAEPRVQIKHHAQSHALKSKLCQAGLTLSSSQAGRQLLVLTLISTATPLEG